MNKLLATLFAGAFALTLGTSAFALDATKTAEPVKATVAKVEPAKVEATKIAEPAKTETVAKPAKKHHRKHAEKMNKAAEAPTEIK
ncbi:MAG: hypothetical protein Q8L73_03800 [Methylotenera sp.]|nr:hypothetical protein [Methylotenera sp.]